MTIIKTDSIAATEVMNKTTVDHGEWREYGRDGRLSLDHDGEPAGTGYRARFDDNPHGADYGWGPLGKTAAEALALLYAETISLREAAE